MHREQPISPVKLGHILTVYFILHGYLCGVAGSHARIYAWIYMYHIYVYMCHTYWMVILEHKKVIRPITRTNSLPFI